MVIATTKTTKVDFLDTHKVVYEKKTFLGTISWFIRVSSEKVGTDLHINTQEQFDDIYLNGEKLTKT